MGMEVKILPIKYFGVLLISTKLVARDRNIIKERMIKRVTSWTAKSFSYAGKVQLAVFVLHSIHAYWSSIFVSPTQVL